MGIQISEVYVGISGNHISLQSSHGVVAVSNEDREIGDDDIERVIQAAKVIPLAPEREIIGVVPNQYVVDGTDQIHDPRSMIGVRLEVEATIVTGTKTAIHNLLRVVEKSGLKVAGLVLMSLAAGHLALSKDEKAIGTVLVDIGAGATTIAVFNENNLVATATLPIGGDYITNDIAYGLRTQADIAEKIKQKFGCALVEHAADDQVFKVNRLGSNVDKEYSQVDLSNIIEPRVQEIFHLIQLEVQRLGFTDLPGGYVLSGGTVSLPGMLAAAQSELDTSVRIAVPDFIGVRDPAFTSGVGIIQYASKYMRGSNPSTGVKKLVSKKSSSGQEQKPSAMERFKNWLSEFI